MKTVWKFLGIVLLSYIAGLIIGLGICSCAFGAQLQERVVNLPEDGGKWYLSVSGKTDDARYAEVLQWFEGHDGLRNLKSRVHYNPVSEGTPTWKERYAKRSQGSPEVLLQDSEGRVVYRAAGRAIPYEAEGLYSALNLSIRHHLNMPSYCPNKPKPTPDPYPLPKPNEDPAPQPLDNGGAPEVEPTWPATTITLVATLLLASFAGGTFLGLNRSVLKAVFLR